MGNFFEKFEDELVLKQTSKGIGTGPISRILSGVNIFLWIYLLINLSKNGFYIPALLFVIFGWGKFSLWMGLGLIIYFGVVKYWPGFILLLLSSIVGWFSVWFGTKNVKKNLFSDKALIDPFEGMNEMTIVYPLQVIFFVLTLISSGFIAGIFWTFFVILLLYETIRIYWRLRSSWCGIHYPLMIRHARIVGEFFFKKKEFGTEYTINDILEELLKSVYKDWSKEKIKSFISTINKKIDNLTDKQVFIEYLIKQFPNFSIEKADKLFVNFYKVLSNPKEYLRTKMIVAEIIERDFGIQEKMKYLFAVISNQAK